MAAELVDLDTPRLRKLASIRTIRAIEPIAGADAIEVAVVDGWKVVVKKGEFKAGDPCVYFEIDSFLPEGNPAWQFLVDKSSRIFEGVKGHVLRTVTLRGQISQGLVLSLDAALPGTNSFTLGDEVTNYLGVRKWEPEIPAQLAGQVKGYFPSWIRKTDEERCQNLEQEIFVDHADATFEITVKLDGTSCTYYHRDGELGVCSRNLDLKIGPENAGNTMVDQLYALGLNKALTAIGRNVAVQGELMGPGIQKNREQLKAPAFFVFNVFDIDAGKYLAPDERTRFLTTLQEAGGSVQHVPLLYKRVKLIDLGLTNIERLLEFAEGPSLHHAVREGVVFKCYEDQFSFKAISNAYLLKEKL